jgi:hypothetical protein
MEAMPSKALGGYVVRLDVIKSISPSHRIDLTLELQPAPDTNSPISRTVFEGVSQLRVDLNLYQYSYISIKDITDRQLEELRYSVSDAEGEVISFLCAAYRPA